MAKKYTLFISDLHLSPTEPETLSQFIDLMHSDNASNADAIYILGDLFEAWLGDDDNSAFSNKVKSVLLSATKNCPVFIMHGNRDFLIGEQFCRECNVQLLSDPITINLYQQSTLLTHGDLLCTDDIAYQNARQKFTSQAFQQRVLAKPLWCRKLLAKYYRWRSKRHQKNAVDEIMDVNSQAVIDMVQQHGVQLLIHGHTHRPGIHYFKTKTHYCKRITLSDWHQQGHALFCTEDGQHNLHSLQR